MNTRELVLGELAILEKLITQAQLDQAIEAQEKARDQRALGEVLVELRLLSRPQLERLLTKQKELIAQYERTATASGLFGRLAVESGYMTERQLGACIRTQLRLKSQGKDVKIGQIMLANGYVTMEQFWEILRAQGDFVCGTCNRVLETPKYEKNAILCDTCGRPAVVLQGF